ncbi:CU044_5270 family protein [Streptomyces sp. NBC_01381]|uniref:CU044_5270 family protein n=1 Tax=Streptomyces sp. NBC_01381 TaxID=2903845 RepID=UPI002257BB8A|nr:CU044_5270 family protein [Streptomyces sp. NBC_01381]MCX4670130.1 CU044_5270 family protein [Streptomyces sp. NBC_01381]
MNAATPSRGEAEAEVEELAGLLPESAEEEWELPPGRHLHHKDLLMQQIDRDTTPVSVSPRRWLLRPAVLMPAAAALAVAGILAATLPFGDADGVRDMGAARGAEHGAAVTLDRIATASLKADTKPVKDGQFVYVRSLVRANQGEFNGPVKLGAPHKREVWMSQNPAPVTDIGMIRESGKGVPMSGQDVPIEASAEDGSDDTGAIPPGPDRPTYAWLASLPTDPDALLKKLYAETRVSDGRETKAQAVFDKIGGLLAETIMPPENAAALYKAVAKLPGVTEVPDAVDAAGRHGIGITIDESAYATRSEWIFDKKSFAYLGSRGYMTKDHKPGGKPGDQGNAEVLYSSDAVLDRAVVDQRGMEPTSGRG